MKTTSTIKELKVTEQGNVKLLLEVELSDFSQLNIAELFSKKDVDALLGNSKIEEKKAPKPAKNDLKKLRGIGVKLEQFLNGQGIKSYEQLTQISYKEMREMLDEGELYIIDPSDWAEQARELMK